MTSNALMNETRRITATVVEHDNQRRDLVISVADNPDGSLTWFSDGRVGSVHSGEQTGDYDLASEVVQSMGLDIMSVLVSASLASESVSCAIDMMNMSVEEIAERASVNRVIVSRLAAKFVVSIPLVDALRIDRGLAFIYREENLIHTGEIVSLVDAGGARSAIVSMMSRSMSAADISGVAGVSAKMVENIMSGERTLIPAYTSARLLSADERTRGRRLSPASSLDRASAYRSAQITRI